MGEYDDVDWQPVDTETVKMRAGAAEALREEAREGEELGETVMRLLE